MTWDWWKSQNSMELKCSVQSSSKNENIVNTSKKLLWTKYWTFPLEQYLIWNLKFFSYFPNASIYQILRCAMFYPWPRVTKRWVSMIIYFKQCCVIDSLLTNNFNSIKEGNVRDNRKCFQDIRNTKLLSWEEGLLEIRPSRR